MRQSKESEHQAEKQYARILQGSDQGFWEWNLKTQEFKVSPRFESMLGYDEGEMRVSPENWAAYVHPDDLAKAWDSIRRHLAGLSSFHEVELRCRTKSGDWKWILTRGRVVARDKDGNPLIMSGTHTDITDRKTIEEREKRLTNIYHALSANNEAILKFESSAELFQYVCRIAVEYGGMTHAWIGIPDSTGRFVSAGRYGRYADPSDPSRLADSAYRITVLTDPDRAEGRGPSGIAFRENRTVVVNDIPSDERLAPWQELARENGLISMAALPIAVNGAPYGVLSVYSDRIGMFDDEIVELLEGMANNLGLALTSNERKTLLKKSEAQFRALFENAGDGIFIGDATGHLVDVNESGAQMLGYTHDEITRLRVKDILAEHERSRVPDSWEGWETGSNAVSEWIFLRKDGSTFEGEVNSQVLPDSRFMGILRNVTEHKRMLAALEEKEQLLSLFIENAPAPIAMYDKNMRYIAVSRRFMEDYHLSGNLTGRNHYDVFPEIPASWKEAHRRGLAGETVRVDEDRFVRKDGSVEWMRWEIKPWYAGGDVGGIIIFSELITGRKQAEEEKTRLSEHLQLALDAAHMGWWHYDPVAAVISFDTRYQQILDLPSLQLSREEILSRIHPEDRIHVWEKVAAALNPADPVPYEAEYRYFMRDGSVRWLNAHGIAKFDGEGEARHAVDMVGTVADITEQKLAQDQLKLAATVYRDSSEAMMVLDDNKRIIMVNHAFVEMTGYEAADLIGQNPAILRAGNHDAAFYEDLWQKVLVAGHFKGEAWHRKKDGQFFAVQIIINTITSDISGPHKYVVLLSDITEKKRSDDLIWLQANFDALTGLPNRRFFRDRLEHEIKNAKRGSQQMAVMLLDLDGFKDVNDTLGHDMGDLLLKEAAERLRKSVRESDTVARLGGDEFTIILTELHGPINVDKVARHIVKSLAEPIHLGQELAYVSASIGITLFPNDAIDADDLIKNADQAMYSAKEEGKNRYHFFTPGMQEMAMKRMRIINDLRNALEANQFEIVYQPIVELSSGAIHKAEALIRWQHPVHGRISPIDFISAAEDTGMISSFGNWIFQEAAKQAAIWRKKYHPNFQISVNISPVQFKNEGIDPTVWLGHLKDLGIPGQGIVVEITEGLLLEASPKVTDQLLMLRDAGIEVALDDFGTGYSSLSYLKKFDIDYLKIDQTFVKNLAENSDDMALCEAIIVMAHKLGIKVIAEGVETGKQQELLTDSGCDFGQGYAFSRPVSAGDLESILDADPIDFATLNASDTRPHLRQRPDRSL